MPIGIADEMDSYLKNQLEHITASFLPKEGLMDMTTYISRNDSVIAADIIKKKCQEMSEWRGRGFKKELDSLGVEKEGSFKRTIRYLKDFKDYCYSG